jgi:hypothetical protein
MTRSNRARKSALAAWGITGKGHAAQAAGLTRGRTSQFGPCPANGRYQRISLKKSKNRACENSPNCNPMEHRRSTPSRGDAWDSGSLSVGAADKASLPRPHLGSAAALPAPARWHPRRISCSRRVCSSHAASRNGAFLRMPIENSPIVSRSAAPILPAAPNRPPICGFPCGGRPVIDRGGKGSRHRSVVEAEGDARVSMLWPKLSRLVADMAPSLKPARYPGRRRGATASRSEGHSSEACEISLAFIIARLGERDRLHFPGAHRTANACRRVRHQVREPWSGLRQKDAHRLWRAPLSDAEIPDHVLRPGPLGTYLGSEDDAGRSIFTV